MKQMEELCLFGYSAWCCWCCMRGRRTDRINNSFCMTRHIGSTTYKVTVVLEENGNESMAEKILRMMRNEMLESVTDCAIINLPQASRQSGRSA